jgi:hypothetical protein
VTIGASLLAAMLGASTTFGQASTTEDFTVTVNPVLTITRPAASVTITHSQADANQVFAAQRWTVAQNSAAGASLTFSTNQAFTHTVESTFKRNAKLDLVLFSSDTGSNWAVTTATDQTDYASLDGVATVAATADNPGDAALDLTVTFLETDFSALASGDYTTTVTGTITSN